MIKFIYTISSFIILISAPLYATQIAVINLEEIINKNEDYLLIIKEIELVQKKHSEYFNNKENKINDLLKEINEQKLLLNEIEINKLIDEYNMKLNTFTNLIDDYNLHFQNEILNIRQIFLKEIIVLLENYAIDNKLDLILDSNSYLISSNSINITKIIEEKLNKIELKLDFKDFEKY